MSLSNRIRRPNSCEEACSGARQGYEMQEEIRTDRALQRQSYTVQPTVWSDRSYLCAAAERRRVLRSIRFSDIRDERVYSIDPTADDCRPSSSDRRGGEVGSAGQCVVLGCEQEEARTPAYLLCPGPLDVLGQPLQPLKQTLACRCATIPVSALHWLPVLIAPFSSGSKVAMRCDGTQV